jgi:hypothetical protein
MDAKRTHPSLAVTSSPRGRLAQVWTHYKIGKLNMRTMFCKQCSYRFWWTAKYEMKSCLNWMVSHQCLPHFESKSYQVNSIKSSSSRSFQQHQRHIPQFPRNFQLWFSFNFSEEIIQYSRTFVHKSKCHGTQKSDVTWLTQFHNVLKSFWNYSHSCVHSTIPKAQNNPNN